MHPGVDKFMMQLRMESKQRENRRKPPISSPDVVQTGDFLFSQTLEHDGDSGKLLLAIRKSDHSDRYLAKHSYTDCACNEFVYTKLAQAMGYCMPDAVLFQLSVGEKRPYFKTEYIIGERYLDGADPCPSYETIRARAKNWAHYFAFRGLYAMTGESDGLEVMLAQDDLLYRVDTTDAFPISNWELDAAGIDQQIGGYNPHTAIREQLLNMDFTKILDEAHCDWWLEKSVQIDRESSAHFLEPFARIQDIPQDYIDGFLNTLCYFYPDFIGDYFKRYISALQIQCREYLRAKR